MEKLFISHASEDKGFVTQLIECLEALNIGYWFDAYEIGSGDSIPQKINEGLRTATYGVLILSPDYLREDKIWTWEELWALINIESTSLKSILIPIRLGLSHMELTQLVPLIAHRLSNDFISRPKDAAHEIALVLNKDTNIVRPLTGENVPVEGLPSRHNIPMHRPLPGGFIGREVFITSLIDQLLVGRERDLSEFGVFALSGIPGFGKSTTACELAYRIGRQFIGGVFWFNSRSAATLKLSAGEVRKLLPSTNVVSETTDADQNSFDDLRHYFENQPCLLILDGLDSEDLGLALVQLIPKSGSSRVVITTRTEKLDLPIKTTSIPLSEIDLVSASEILVQFRPIPQSISQSQVIADICHELGLLPLALQLAARYLRETSLSFSDYLDRLRTRGPAWKGLASTINTIPSVIEVFNQSIEDISSYGKTGELALKILHRCAAIDLVQGRLHRWDCEDHLFGRLPVGLAASVGVAKNDEDAVDQFDEAISTLERSGLIRLNPDSSPDIWMHALTLRFMKDCLDPEDAQYLAFRLHIDWTNTKLMMSRTGWVDYFQEMYQPAKDILPKIKKLSPDAALASLETLYAMADFSDQPVAENIIDDAIAFVEALDESPDSSRILTKLGIDKAYSVYKAKRLTEAEILYEKLSDDMKGIGARIDYLSDYAYYFGCLLLELGSDERISHASKLWGQAIEMLLEDLALLELENAPPSFIFQLKLRLGRLFQAYSERFPIQQLDNVKTQTIKLILAELETSLGNSMTWERQFLQARGPLRIVMTARFVRSVPIVD
jgi:tetratricopeptide (TPR) repeat protein